MNTLVGETGNAGAVAFGGPQKTAPANPSYTVGAVGFGPSWQDDEPSLRQMYDAACQTIVRLECELDELRAANAIAEQERAILVREMERLREAWADDRCRESCRDKEAADRIGGNPWSNR